MKECPNTIDGEHIWKVVSNINGEELTEEFWGFIGKKRFHKCGACGVIDNTNS